MLLAEHGPCTTLLPTGLVLCAYCGGVRDQTPGGRRSVCRCGGIPCRYCGAGRIHRPTTDHYELDDRTLWHCPYFGQYLPCRHCSALARRLTPGTEGWPAVGETPELSVVLGPVRRAAHALASPGFVLGGTLPDHDLVAVHGDVERWHDLYLGAPPDNRPLYVGRSLSDVELRGVRGALAVAIWVGTNLRARLEQTLAELLVRWQPPLNTEVPTSWRR